jgi:hypothetical protein
LPCFALLTALSAVAQTSGTVAVPEQVSVLVRPVLDELQRYRSDDGKTPQRLLEYFYALTKKQGRFSDEALVVLMCFDVMGESQEDADAVIARGRKMLPYIEKYQHLTPKVSGRTYPDSLLKSYSEKQNAFQGTTKAIQHAWRGTWDNPQGN